VPKIPEHLVLPSKKVEPYWQSPCGVVSLYLGDCFDILPKLDVRGTIVTDPPYSSRTHDGHDASANGHLGEGKDNASRSTLGYSHWTSDHVKRFVAMTNKVCDGWMVCFTDHTLAPDWCQEMESIGRYVFAPLPWYCTGLSVRLSGDGPSSWTAWIVVSRTAKELKWGTLPGGYTQHGHREHMGGKPVELMAAIVSDYTRTGSTVIDPCMGSASTGLAAIQCGCKFIGIEQDEQYIDTAVRLLRAKLDSPSTEPQPSEVP
jgi:site-specific DNA-methyltransferase (adenine-specific)